LVIEMSNTRKPSYWQVNTLRNVERTGTLSFPGVGYQLCYREQAVQCVEREIIYLSM